MRHREHALITRPTPMTTTNTRTKATAIAPGPGPVIAWITTHPKTYLAACLAIGLVGRVWLAHWDAGTFMDPLFPVIHH